MFEPRAAAHISARTPTPAKSLLLNWRGAFVCASIGIVPTVRHADYIGSWLVLKSDKRRIFNAASHAQRAADFLFGLQPNATAQSNVA
jgi:antirestriction protein ArdC